MMGLLHFSYGLFQKANMRCCGSELIDTSRQMCCWKNVQDRLSDNTVCCGTNAFEKDSHMCCKGDVYPRTDGCP